MDDGNAAGTEGNADQIAFWNAEAGLKWVALQERIDAMMAPLTVTLLERAAPAPGERALDIGCGFGTTAIALAARVAPGGAVLGVDVSRPMLDLAARRIAAEGIGGIELLEGDATTHPFSAGSIDLAVSRFGVMFFADPVAAFSNIRRALREGGRLAFVCWRPLADNPCFLVPFLAAKPHMPPQPAPDPAAPGMFAFADPERLRGILGAAGFHDVALEANEPLMVAGPVDRVLQFSVQMGPLTRAMAEATPVQRSAAETAIGEALRAHEGPDGVRLTGAVWIVTARG